MRTIDFTTLKETALILTFFPRAKEAARAPLRDGYTRYHDRFSLPLGETRAQAAVRAIGGV
jgi:hypothetical protein